MDLSQIQRLDSKLNELHDFEKLDLGYTDKDLYGDAAVCGPSKKERNKKRYPSMYISRLKSDPFDLPDTGEAKIKFKVVSRETTNRDGKTRNTASIEVQSMDIDRPKKKKDLESVSPGMIEFRSKRKDLFGPAFKELGHRNKRRGTLKKGLVAGSVVAGTALALKASRKKKKKKEEGIENLETLSPGMINFTDPRPRNQQGMFADSTEAGANPETMKKAYGGNSKFSSSQVKALRRKLPRGLPSR